MEIIKKNLVVIVIVLILLILVLMRSIGLNHFKSDAKSMAEPSVKQSNMITGDKVSSLTGEKLFINLGGDLSNELEAIKISLSGGKLLINLGGDLNNEVEAIRISPDSILIKNNISSIMKHDGPVILCSSEPAISARIWMLLSQMGRKNIFILTNASDNEILKYKFVKDSPSTNN